MRNAKDKRIVAAIQDEMASAEGAQSDEMQQNRQNALKYYQGAPRGDEKKGRSQIVSMDLASSVNATLALMKGMLVEECSVQFEAYGPEDEALAKAEGDIVSDCIFKDNAGKMRIMSAVKDGLLSRQAVMALDVDEIDGQNRISVRAVPSENVSYQAGYEGHLQDIRFFAEMVPYTRSDLVSMGCDKATVWKLPTMDTSSYNGASQARDTKSSDASAPERAEDLLAAYWVYLLIDLNDDGISERWRVLYCDNTVLKKEEFDVVPYAMGSPFLSPHRLTGESMYDRLRSIQDTNTDLTRQLIDNVNIVNNGRYIYDPARCSEDDVLTPTAGGGIRARDPSAVVPLQVPDVSMGILASLEFTRRRRSEIAGSALEMASADAQMMNKSATQASIDKSNSELVTSLIAHNFAETLIRDLWQLTRYYLRKYATRPYIARVNGQAVPVDPLSWPAERRIIVNAGKSPGEKAQEAMALQGHIGLLAQAMQSGMDGQLADANTLYRTQMAYLKLNGVEDPESLAIDPGSPQAQQARQAASEAAQQAQAMQQDQMEKVYSLEQAKIAEDARQHDGDLQFKYLELETKTETDIAKITVSGQLDLERQQRENDAKAAAAAAGRTDTPETIVG